MLKFLLDEDMPCSTARVLRDEGFEVLDVRDCGLRGKSDNGIYEFAQKEKATILTADVGFSNILHFPVGRHSGIVIAHFPNEISTPELNRRIIEALGKLSVADFMGSLIIIEPGKIRIRREQR